MSDIRGFPLRLNILWKITIRWRETWLWVRQVVQYHMRLCSVGCEFAGWPVLPGARAALSERARAGGVMGLWTLTIWPLGGWFPHWLSLFPANNWDLIWEEISKAPVTPLLRSDRFLSLALKETSPSQDALWRPWLAVGSFFVTLWLTGVLSFYLTKISDKSALGTVHKSWL